MVSEVHLSHLGAALRDVRQGCTITVSEVARRLNVARNTVQRWEFEERRPTVDDVKRLLRAVNATAEQRLSVWSAFHGVAVDQLPAELGLVPDHDDTSDAAEVS